MNKKMHWTMLAVPGLFILGLFSPAALALGLGGAVVESYLGQPLDIRVELISQNEAELQSITAGLASAEDFELLGLSRTAITVPLEFEVVTEADKPHVHITSQLNVNEPVVQFLVEVVWTGGRMLREYTLFLDPPTIDSPAPPVAVRPAPVKTPPVETNTSPIAPIQKNVVPREQQAETPAPAAAKPDVDVESAADTVASKSKPAEVTAEVPAEIPAEGTEQAQAQEQQPPDQAGDAEVYGPVARGETLWGIARDYSRGSGYSVNQAMLALQRKNPEAFIKGNINSLRRGAILRLPAFSELAELTSREALLEVLRQEEEIRNRARPAAADFGTPTVADSGDYQSSASEPVPGPVLNEDDGHLELVPPAEDELQETQAAQPVPEQDAPVVESLQAELSRTEEELLNARQENTYLAERIRELEAEAAAREEQAVKVEDSSLANMESKLAQDRAADRPEQPLAITPGGEKQAWYAGKTPLLLVVAIVLIALITWVLRRRNAGLQVAHAGAEAPDSGDDAEVIKPTRYSRDVEGETVVQVKPEPAKPGPEPVFESEPVIKPEAVIESEPVFKTEFEQPGWATDLDEGEGQTVVIHQDGMDFAPEAEPEIDFEEPQEEPVNGENDPEIKLDLARAYLSLGDKEASRSMLDEVLKSGNAAQKAEARQMLDEL